MRILRPVRVCDVRRGAYVACVCVLPSVLACKKKQRAVRNKLCSSVYMHTCCPTCTMQQQVVPCAAIYWQQDAHVYLGIICMHGYVCTYGVWYARRLASRRPQRRREGRRRAVWDRRTLRTCFEEQLNLLSPGNDLIWVWSITLKSMLHTILCRRASVVRI